MFCGNCGAKIEENARFCGECGQPVSQAPVQQTGFRPAPPAKAARRPWSRKTKVITAVSVGIVGAAAVTYSLFHFTYGPSSPAKLEEKLQAAVTARDVDQLLTYLDDSNTAMRAEDRVEAFRKAFNDETAYGYESYLKDALYAAEQEAEEDSDYGTDGDGDGAPVYFVKESSWRGTRWVFNVTPAEVTMEQGEDWTAGGSLETLESAQGTFNSLWPAVYSYQAKVTNPYGGSETLEGTVDLLNTSSEEIYLYDRLESGLRVEIPTFADITYTLNGKELPQAEDGDDHTLSIVPKPAELKVEAKGTYLGMPVEQSRTWEASETDDIELETLLKDSVAAQAAKLLLEANVSWTKAYNAADSSLLTGLDPDGDAYQTFSEVPETPGRQVRLVRVAVAPDNIEFYEDGVRITAEEEYAYPGTEESNSTSSNTYVITPKPGQEQQWWIRSSSRNYWVDDLFGNSESLILDNPEN
ncbi:zinc-ribbon domain-containing protein [Paenibacillus glufosinatiresistens]|uniref:zinc-ribbon domain-containing protein n=1 Tax=Paenibacillus glufosinatiresistens TaxID=3070657 RepID=UPI00286E0478|nr:zinc-ribbon domain-containing protein [Paenibacillus sp. YX.27]